MNLLNNDTIQGDEIQQRINDLRWGDAESYDKDELAALEALKSDLLDVFGSGSSWKYATLISEDYMEEYAREYCRDVITDFDDSRWPYTHIDWGEAADEFKNDFSEVSTGKMTFYVRE